MGEKMELHVGFSLEGFLAQLTRRRLLPGQIQLTDSNSLRGHKRSRIFDKGQILKFF